MKIFFYRALLAFALSILQPISYAQIFKNISSSKTLKESLETFEQRKISVINYFFKQQVGETLNIDSHKYFSLPAVARVFYGLDGDIISKKILQPKFRL